MTAVEALKNKLDDMGCAYLCEEAMSRHTTFKIGGAAELFITPDSPKQAAKIIKACLEDEIKYYVLGNGSNILVDDNGLRGAVIAFSQPMSKIIKDGCVLTAQAGATLASLCRFACENSLGGLEFAFGIPGSVGGAVYMNAGAYGGEIKDIAVSVKVLLKSGEICDILAEQADFGYRESAFQKNEAVICEASFKLSPSPRENIKEQMNEILERRKAKQPLEFPSAGSAFKRPPNSFAAALIDECGLKGFSIGGAQVSEKHAGFIINRGGATCKDVLSLLDYVKETVYKRSGIVLSPEIRYLG